MEIWLSQFLSPSILDILPAITLIVVGVLVEKYYVGRIAILSNAVALTTYYYKFENLSNALILYINILTIFGILSLISYAFKIKLPKDFYFIAGIFSSVISGLILLGGIVLI